MLSIKLSSRKVSVVVSNSEHVWKGSKDTKHWPHVHVRGVSARTFFTLKLATPEQRACVNVMQTHIGK